jgi:MoaA/NifB/PqqE/SkfB family radical SAM enzyme
MALTRHARRLRRRLRQARFFVSALKTPYRPVLVHLIPTRRCNLACTYCNEFDDHSPPVPTADLWRRIDRLAELGTGIVTLSGGEPLLHPDADAIISHIRSRGMIATLITNGYLLTRDRIRRLNRAGLDHLQISIDNVLPDDVSKKSLKVLDRKLQWLAGIAEFDVTVNSVVGGGVRDPQDAVTIAERARSLGFSTTAGIIHDTHGELRALDSAQRSILDTLIGLGGSTFDLATYNRFQKNLANGRPNDWHCGAGARYLYVCEDGLVHWCSQQRGYPGIPLEQYGVEDLEREYRQVKSCAPYCTVGCVHRVAQVDELRENPQAVLSQWFPSTPDNPTARPLSIRMLTWAFVDNPHRRIFRDTAARLFGARRQAER